MNIELAQAFLSSGRRALALEQGTTSVVPQIAENKGGR
jgi:hypothetical protein